MAQTQAAARAADPGAGDGHHNQNFWALTLGCIGVVYGDIGTSPLYAFKEAINAAVKRGLSIGEATLGVLSLILWSLTLIVARHPEPVRGFGDNNLVAQAKPQTRNQFFGQYDPDRIADFLDFEFHAAASKPALYKKYNTLYKMYNIGQGPDQR